MKKTGTALGEKTIIDSILPGARTAREHSNKGPEVALILAYQKAKEGAENTKKMKGVHGRIAYYGDQTIGWMDGGAFVGSLIYKAISETFYNKK